ncbi:MAG: helix-turn-helix domain-containing protein [Candidatus Neomarinimicrobiota bacterium]
MTVPPFSCNKSEAARILKIDLSTLYRKIDRYSLPKNP